MSGAHSTDTICAIATPPGSGGIGVIRVSGPDCVAVCAAIAGAPSAPRSASLRQFRDGNGEVIDQGLLLYFPAPHSFTGEDVIELHAHGGMAILQLLLQALLQQADRFSIRAARPGEFSERAFRNDKIDLTQAEAIADLINASSTAAVKAAQRSLQGGLSKPVALLQEKLIELRVWIEAALDFPDEEIDFLADERLQRQLRELGQQADHLLRQASQGARLLQGARLAIMGPPNAGKSSLLNALLKRDAAIVTDIPGTTRDVLREQLEIEGVAMEIVDTAGLHRSEDRVEQEGMRRAREELASADLVLWVEDMRYLQNADPGKLLATDGSELPQDVALLPIANKLDLITDVPIEPAGKGFCEDCEDKDKDWLYLSAKTGVGLRELELAILKRLGLDVAASSDQSAQIMAARPRHIAALQQVSNSLQLAAEQLTAGSGELAGEELLAAQQALSEITGAYHNDDLLGAIFSSFCIGK
jgi:tRNA modification GTPase